MTRGLTKAIVLARGLGKRMRAADAAARLEPEQDRAASAGVKAMIPVGRPFLDYVLSGLADAGYRDVCLIIGPEHGLVRDHYARVQPRLIELAYAVQAEPRGTADALLAAQDFAAEDDFAVLNGDNYYPADALRTLREAGEPGTVLFESDALVRHGTIARERIRSYAYADVANGYLLRLSEKPEPGATASDALVSMNLWRFSPAIFEHCSRVEPSTRGEYELPAAVNRAIQHGMRLRVQRSRAGVLDLSQRADVAAVAERLRTVNVVL